MRLRGVASGGHDRREGPGAETLRSAGPSSLWLVIILGLAVAVTAVAGLMAYQLVYGQRVILGVKVHDVDVGGLSSEDASKLIRSKLLDYERGPIPLRLGEQEWKLSPAQMGVQFDGDKSADAALQAGKQGNPLDKIVAQFDALGSGVTVEPTFTVDAEKYAAAVKRLAVQIDQAAVNAVLKIEGVQVRMVAPKEGLSLDQSKLLEKLELRVQTLSRAPIEIPVTRIAPKVTEQDLAPAKARAEQMLSGPIKVTLDGRILEKWTLDQSKLAAMVLFDEKETNGKRQMTVSLDKEAVRDLAEKVAAEVNQKPLNARFDWNSGNLKAISQGRDGRALDVDQFARDLETAATSPGERKVALPLRVEKPAVGPGDGPKLGIKAKVEERRTDYSGGAAERRYNVRLGASRVNGVVVPPNAVFSFNDEVGDITEENGYQLGFAIIGGDTVPDPGGGICQVSTTVFQSIFYAGYEIVERNPHAYRIRRYEQPLVGIDAAVYPPDLDLRFRNNSDSYLLIQARTDDQWLYVTLYGTKPNWSVSVDGPQITNVVKADRKQIVQYTPKMEKGRQVVVETAEDGLDVTVNRTVQRGSETISKDKIFTRFRPERNVTLIGTGGVPAPPEQILPEVAPTATAVPTEEVPTPEATTAPSRASATPTPARR